MAFRPVEALPVPMALRPIGTSPGSCALAASSFFIANAGTAAAVTVIVVVAATPSPDAAVASEGVKPKETSEVFAEFQILFITTDNLRSA